MMMIWWCVVLGLHQLLLRKVGITLECMEYLLISPDLHAIMDINQFTQLVE